MPDTKCEPYIMRFQNADGAELALDLCSFCAKLPMLSGKEPCPDRALLSGTECPGFLPAEDIPKRLELLASVTNSPANLQKEDFS